MASKRRLRRKQCGNKLVHDRQDALYHAHLLRQKTGDHVTAYKCPFGSHWHVGHAKETA
jgi:hypothetical protein